MGLGEAMNEKTLVVMAAGMGSRFGGLLLKKKIIVYLKKQ